MVYPTLGAQFIPSPLVTPSGAYGLSVGTFGESLMGQAISESATYAVEVTASTDDYEQLYKRPRYLSFFA